MIKKKSDKVLIFDTTLRDGEQAPGASMNKKEKLEVAYALERLGVDIIEAGFPVISKGDFESVSIVAKHIKKSIVCGLARSIKKDIDAASDALKKAKNKRIHVFLATSNIHMQHKLRKNKEEILKMAVDAVKYAKKKAEDIEFSPEDASRTEKGFLYSILEAVIKAGARTVNIPDTVGYSVPSEYGQLIDDIMNNVPNINKAIVSVHCHDDLGVSVANSLEAVKKGARQVECTINGIGERAGNASMEEIVMALKTRSDLYGCITGIKTPEICRVSRLVSKYTGFAVAPNKAIVGHNAFRHEAGIHQDGILKERTTYEIMKPEDVGFLGTGLVLGKHSGRHAFKERLKALGIELGEKELDKAFDRFKDVADKKKQVFDEDLLAIVEDEVKVFKKIWTLESLAATTGTGKKPMIDIKLRSKGKIYCKSGTGDGPVDACYKAIESITKINCELLDYSIQSVTRGKDALGEVTVKVKAGDKKVIAHGASTDIFEASVKAYINAINKVLS
ncbi:MAG: 2-isopropylmalate synthase [Omnitrophica WOR_2 bacterium GWF2_38_59]|nr:MAG: 2-isopropylmalate synthase [Omnitrophica WOR_2 bacterium GWF2_38_59]OGX47792.1 MAG: 2-isopropylmalate synthase [Omnitrophica WOR_2 bacterium RIFOXYA2_FULL_38_17]OGX56043.1 MAG: 2-isopropylmalate synthase [Omnitrophica WOR_2 bacterium RIFOXYB2_FULL_38_16]OGX56947.1 MAG: 2-isopropylmalate synthase [Omnitrophica WOR_2 bacterium RIFOXYC2_FULL_38_12]HBG60325.1 2-isopropylmalate synthase [Candidatus Omnitrophota bacterium]